MAEKEKTINTGLECLRSLAANFCRDVNFDALLNDELVNEITVNPEKGLLELSNKLSLVAQFTAEADLKEDYKDYIGPLLVQLDNDNWICIVNADDLYGTAEVTIFDPLGGEQKLLKIDCDELLKKVSGGATLKFTNLFSGQDGKNSGLYCVTALGKHHNVDIDVRRLLHEYAVEGDEISERLFYKIISDYGMKVKKISLPWDKLTKLGEALPAVVETKSGGYIILVGIREVEGEKQLAVVNPAIKMKPGEQFLFFTQEQYEETCTGKAWLIKRVYSLTDEEQPFSLRWFIPEFMKLKGIFTQIALAVLIITGIALITPLFFQIVVDKVLIHESYTTLNVLGIGIIIALLFNALMEFLRGYLLLFATNKIDIRTATKTFAHLMNLPVDFFERMSSGVLIKHMQQSEKIRGFLSGNLFFTILELFSLIIFIPFMMIYSVKLTLIVLGFTAIMALIIATLIKPFQRRLTELYQAEGKKQGMLVEAIHGIRTVKSLALEPIQKKKWNDSTAYAITRHFRVGKISLTAKTLSQLIEKLLTVTIIWVGAMSVFDKELTVGALIAFQMLSGRVTGPLVRLVSLIHEYQQTALSVRMLGNVMNAPPEPAGGGVHNPIKGNISFANVTFKYIPDTPNIINDFSLDIPAGATLGIVGRSGSGKTTMTKLLQGLYQLQSGIIKIDGIDIKEIDKAHLRSSIGVVLQENYFFHGTVRENISLTKRNASIEEIIHAAKMAGADEFVQDLTKGYDTVLEENASNLSGGQKQRLAIARALLTNPPILIFDEATSALDPESETIIQRNLAAIAKGRTVIIVSHRLSIVHDSDRILVIDKGERTALAPHQELVKQPGVYQEFWQQQMGRYGG
ncbi:MAG: ATP-binding cassette domain-containing protein [Victivallaceae bacterium]|nr:ATP-binding cassette domain-containing protein [Victivallaceae bacterium]